MRQFLNHRIITAQLVCVDRTDPVTGSCSSRVLIMAAGGNKRKRQQQQETNGATSKKQQKRAALSTADEKAIDAELKRVNDMLQKEETSQKRTLATTPCCRGP